MKDEIGGEKIRCSGYRIEGPYSCIRHHGHHGKCVIIKRGKCRVMIPVKWKR